jgi:thermitase
MNTQFKNSPRFNVIFKGFTIQLVEDKNFVSKVLEATSNYLKSYSESLAFNPEDPNHCHQESDLIEITIRSQSVSVKEAWNLSYRLMQELKKEVVYIEPRFALATLASGNCSGPGNFDPRNPGQLKSMKERCKLRREKGVCGHDWPLVQMNVRDAWKKFDDPSDVGKGITIALPDSGFLPHPEVPSLEEFDETSDEKNKYIEGDRKLINVQEEVGKLPGYKALPSTYWHGTATASLIVSPDGQQVSNEESTEFVTGVAPGATLKPYPLGPTSADFEFFSPSLARAISDIAENADKENIRVISLSFGSHPSLALRRAIIKAQRAGIIVVASAGNGVRFTQWPAAYDSVIAVAASTIDQKLATFSSIGSRVDVAAPGEFVYVAVAKNKDGKLHFTVEPKYGTSFSAPLVAGIAAMWLSYHGWDKLVEKYGAARVPLVFDKLLRKTCYAPSGWDKNQWGAGIVDAEALLDPKRAPLPELEEDFYIQEPLAYREVDHVRLDRGGLETFLHLFEETLCSPDFLEGIAIQIAADFKLSSLINSDYFGNSLLAKDIRLDIAQWTLKKFLALELPGKDFRQFLRTFGREIAFHLGTDLALYQRMEKALKKFAGLRVDTQDDLRSILADLSKVASPSLQQQLEPYIITPR